MRYSAIDSAKEYEQIKEAFRKLGAENSSESSYESAKQKVLSLLPLFNLMKYTLTGESFPSRLFRVRKESGISEEESLDNVATFSYPSPEKCHMERANIEGCPVFYLADHLETALKEAEVEEGDVVFVSEWKLENPESTHIFLFLSDGLPESHPWKKVWQEQWESFKASLTDLPEDQQFYWKEMYKEYCRAFLGDQYTISSLLGHQLLYGQDEPHVQLLLYPSKANSENYCNLAVHPDFADTYLKAMRVDKIRVLDKGLEQTPELLQVGEVQEQNINWHKPEERGLAI